MPLYSREDIKDYLVRTVPRLKKDEPKKEPEEAELRKQGRLADMAREHMRRLQ